MLPGTNFCKKTLGLDSDVSWVVAWMILADQAALIEATRVLNATALAIVLCRAETFLVRRGRVLEECYGYA